MFLAELCLFAVLAWAGARLGTGFWAVMLAIALPLVVAVLWVCCWRLGPRAGSGTRPG